VRADDRSHISQINSKAISLGKITRSSQLALGSSDGCIYADSTSVTSAAEDRQSPPRINAAEYSHRNRQKDGKRLHLVDASFE